MSDRSPTPSSPDAAFGLIRATCCFRRKDGVCCRPRRLRSPGKRSAPGAHTCVSDHEGLGHGVIPGCGLRPYPGYVVCLRRGEKARTSVMTSHRLATNRLPKPPAAGTLSACVTVARVSEAHPGHTHACQITRGLVTAPSPDAAFGLIRATHCRLEYCECLALTPNSAPRPS